MSSKQKREQLVEVTFPWSEATYLSAGDIAYQYKMQYSYKRFIGYFFVAMIAFGVYRLYRYHDYSAIYIGTILTIYWYYIRRMLYKSRLKKQFKKEPISSAQMNIGISDSQIIINGNKIPWYHISRVIAHPDGFLLERAEGYPYLPASSFPSDESIRIFTDIVANKDIEIVSIR